MTGTLIKLRQCSRCQLGRFGLAINLKPAWAALYADIKCVSYLGNVGIERAT